jgi:hypothetical protein
MWKLIDGYDKYEVSEEGQIRNTKTGLILKPIINQGGYYKLSLCNNGKISNHVIHQLVGLAFIENPYNYIVIDHINHIKTDNRISNLRWASTQQNVHNTTTHALQGIRQHISKVGIIRYYSKY